MIWYLIGIWIRSGSGLFDKKQKVVKPPPVLKATLPKDKDLSHITITEWGLDIQPTIKFRNETNGNESEIGL